MDGDFTRKPPRDLPFYQTSERVRKSVDIIREAKTELLHSELRSLSTRRPETPQDEGRQLFCQSSARDLSTRPPSSFRCSETHCIALGSVAVLSPGQRGGGAGPSQLFSMPPSQFCGHPWVFTKIMEIPYFFAFPNFKK